MYNSNTLQLYLLAGGLSVCLSLVLLGFAYFQQGTRLLKSSAVAMLMLSVGFAVSGIGPDLPRWATVIGTNLLLLSTAPVVHSAFAAHCLQQPVRPDRWGWSVVALAALPFWYWGLIEPDGNYRSAVFSLAVAAISVRTTAILISATKQRRQVASIWTLALLFGVLTVWMATRSIACLVTEPPEPSLRGANPTSWQTVFGYIVLVSVMTVCFIWLELSRPATPGQPVAGTDAVHRALVFRNRLYLLWGTVLVLLLAIGAEAGVYYLQTGQSETRSLTQTTALINDALAHHSLQVINQVDTLLHSVRRFYQHTHSAAQTETFINALPFDKTAIGNIYLADAQGALLVSHDPLALGRSIADRDYFQFHHNTLADQMFVGPVNLGRVTGLDHFRLTRRITLPDGSFAGVVIATVAPESFLRYYRDLLTGPQNMAALLGTQDRLPRVSTAMLPRERWQMPVESPLWQALQQAPAGSYTNVSPLDAVQRTFVYKRLPGLPLVMVTGFSEADTRLGMAERLRWLVTGTLTVAAGVLVLAAQLTVEIRRRDEQNSFMLMLSHELKAPLSVLRMALDGPLSPSTRHYAQQSVQDMDAIVERCLQADRLQQSRYTPEHQRCNLAELLAQCRSACQSPDRLVLELPALPTFKTDTQLLSVALGNLIDNALKYAAPGSLVTISAASLASKKQPGVLVSISNTPGSVGSPDANQVFQKYYRGTRARSKTGSGLGLYLVASIARLLDGWVRYVPQANCCRFELWLPV